MSEILPEDQEMIRLAVAIVPQSVILNYWTLRQELQVKIYMIDNPRKSVKAISDELAQKELINRKPSAISEYIRKNMKSYKVQDFVYMAQYLLEKKTDCRASDFRQVLPQRKILKWRSNFPRNLRNVDDQHFQTRIMEYKEKCRQKVIEQGHSKTSLLSQFQRLFETQLGEIQRVLDISLSNALQMFLRCSMDMETVRLLMTDPQLQNQLLWTKEEDKFLIDSLKSGDKESYEVLRKIKGDLNIQKRHKYLKSISSAQYDL